MTKEEFAALARFSPELAAETHLDIVAGWQSAARLVDVASRGLLAIDPPSTIDPLTEQRRQAAQASARARKLRWVLRNANENASERVPERNENGSGTQRERNENAPPSRPSDPLFSAVSVDPEESKSARASQRNANGTGNENASERPTRTVKERVPKKAKTGCPSSATDPESWLASWAIPSTKNPIVGEHVQHFLDTHRKKGDEFSDWGAAWRTWKIQAKSFGRPIPDVGPIDPLFAAVPKTRVDTTKISPEQDAAEHAEFERWEAQKRMVPTRD